MARLIVKDYFSIGIEIEPTATSWQVSTDPNFKKIVDESLEDEENIFEWVTPLKKIGYDDLYYENMNMLYARFKFWFNDKETQWFNMNVGNQNMQELTFIRDGEVVKVVSPENSLIYS